MYVAMTRAREKLTISFYGLPSRFLYEIPDKLLSAEDLPTIDEDGIIVK
jgi:superfamily I DNA/RNA helicase